MVVDTTEQKVWRERALRWKRWTPKRRRGLRKAGERAITHGENWLQGERMKRMGKGRGREMVKGG